MTGRQTGLVGVVAVTVVLPLAPLRADINHEAIQIRPAAGAIRIDGELSDPGWAGASRVETWYETRPGDNVEPRVGNVAYLAFDDEFFYASFEFQDPEPHKIRAPLANRDDVPSYTDYGGVLIDASNDGRTAQMFLANARGIQYDALSSDDAGEDSAPDFFWESAARVTEDGWVLEMRIPFSSLRYKESDPEQWRILLYRNHPREFRYQIFSSRLPRDSTCFICNSRPLVGLGGLPSGSHWVAAPYVTGSQTAEPEGDVGTPMVTGDLEGEMGLDAKWAPNPGTVLDLTLNPDFSQIESDVPLITDNERFALFFEEKRPFFLEGADLFRTSFQAIYTRTFTSPRWGARATGTTGDHTYMLLAGEDRGGGSVIIPGPTSSELADQDYQSGVVMGRYRRTFGQSFASILYSGREIDGGAYSRVLGPDFRWQVTDNDVITGQLLFSESETPNLPDLADEWDGRKLSGHAAELWWYHQTSKWDSFALYNDVTPGFRADNGFVPRVDYERVYSEVGRSFYPEEKPISRLRLFAVADYMVDQQGELIHRRVIPGFGFDALWNSFVRFDFSYGDFLAEERVFRVFQVRPTLQVRPGGVLSEITLQAAVGDEIDFANERLGDGATFRLSASIRPSDHLELAINADRRWLDVTTEEGISGRLFTADLVRLKATYTLNAKSWVRLIGEWMRTERRLALYDEPEDYDELSEALGGSLLFAYKLNWQSVLYVGYGDSRELDELERERLEPAGRRIFVKLSYAFQR